MGKKKEESCKSNKQNLDSLDQQRGVAQNKRVHIKDDHDEIMKRGIQVQFTKEAI